ncbi:hypothetical protein BH18ACT10_BH18ACT10_08230 [soil metagenome]
MIAAEQEDLTRENQVLLELLNRKLRSELDRAA